MFDLLLTLLHLDLGLSFIHLLDSISLLLEARILGGIIDFALPNLQCLTVTSDLLLHLSVLFNWLLVQIGLLHLLMIIFFAWFFDLALSWRPINSKGVLKTHWLLSVAGTKLLELKLFEFLLDEFIIDGTANVTMSLEQGYHLLEILIWVAHLHR